MVERLICNQVVVGPIPTSGSKENPVSIATCGVFCFWGARAHEKRPPTCEGRRPFLCLSAGGPYLEASSTATATATVAPTMGLLPMPMRPIISTCAGTEEEPANCASECMRPMVSVMP